MALSEGRYSELEVSGAAPEPTGQQGLASVQVSLAVRGVVLGNLASASDLE